MGRWRYLFVIIVFGFGWFSPVAVDCSTQLKIVRFKLEADGKSRLLVLSNDLVKYFIGLESDRLAGDELAAQHGWLAERVERDISFETDADFGLDIMWTDWRAPGKADNADNLVVLSKNDFRFEGYRERELPEGGKELEIDFSGRETPLMLRLTYRLEPDSFYVRRKLAVRSGTGPASESAFSPGPHFLRRVWPLRARINSPRGPTILKSGGFGQPAALLLGSGGGFFGLEYPASENSLRSHPDGTLELSCGQEIGERIADSWVESDWVVEALTPDRFVKLWFWRYLDRIRASPLRPYVLYNSWYDLRTPRYGKGPERSLNEVNLLEAAGVFQKKLFEERGVPLDAFVLDDGWDVYAGDWILSPDQFPRGLAPISKAIEPMGAHLGIWFGPIGGYFQRDVRVNWMKEHGYETVGGQLCVAGERYRSLLEKRVTDFIHKDGVGYFKWDGIQFSCSEPGHGHLPGVYSRRAVMEAVAGLSHAARAERNDIFLNITSGTWLSPWWVKNADAIWMQGQDYGFADVPSISRRDQSTTYRDSVLYDDLKVHDFWFPVSSLMTHGVIKAHISPFADPKEPLDKFTDEVVLYAARGIAMWELYISPDLLTSEEWDVEARVIRWLKQNFEILKSVEMIGGDPRRHEPYGYAHYLGRRAIIALRNPVINPQAQRVLLSPEHGLAADAADLVLERVYPDRWVSRRLFKAGDDVDISLQGFETAVYEIYPLSEAEEPLLAGARFDSTRASDEEISINIYPTDENVRFINPEKIKELTVEGKKQDPGNLIIPKRARPESVRDVSFSPASPCIGPFDLKFTLQEPASKAVLAVLLVSAAKDKGKNLPALELIQNGKAMEADLEQEKGSWAWNKVSVGQGVHHFQIRPAPGSSGGSWTGRLSVWLIAEEKLPAVKGIIKLKEAYSNQRALLPRPFPAGVFSKLIKLGETAFKLESRSFLP
jgi:hypothetical protein